MEREVTQSSTRSILSEKEKPVQVEGGKEEKFAMADKVNSTAGKNIIEDPFNEKPITCEEVKTAALVDEDHKIDESHFEDDGEDLPDNFFDDFSNQDFMAGLDIVDDWIDDGEEIERQPVESLKQKTKDPKYEKSVHKSSRDKSRYDDYDRSRYDRSRRRYSRDDGRYFKEIHRRRSRSPHRRSHSAHKRSRSRNRRSRSRNRQSRSKHGTDKHHAGEKKECDEERNSEGHGDQRRDPEKTKRDIQRDKVRCAKDIEARVFQEQIRVAETGLVPPGTELDVVLEKEKLREEAEKEKERNKENKRDIEVKEDENKKERPAEKRRPSSRSRSDRKPIRIDGSKPYSPTRDTSINRDDNVEKYKEGPAGHRRDPEKTKHDIQRDKVRCAKDVEIRVFQEQIKVAETGLVPPGTELDVVLEKEKLKEEVTKQKESKPSSGLKESESRKDKKNEDREKRKTSPRPRPDRRRYRSPIKLSHLRDRSRSRSFSPKRRRRNSHSYERERRLRSRSRRRDSREIDLRYRLREKREKYFNELSPVSDKRMSRSPSMFNISPQSLISDRESWLRDRERMDRYGRTRHSRSCSPVSSSSFTERDRGGSPRRRTKKFSFMEELEIKLKNSRVKPPPSLLVTVPNEGAYAPHPTMVPHPHDFAPQGQMNMPFQPNPPMFMGPAPSMCPPPDPNHMHMGPSISDPNMIPPLMNIHVNAPPMMDMLPQPMMSNMAPGMPLGMPGGVPQGVPPPAMVPFPGGPGPCPVPCPVPPVQTPQGMYFDPNQYNPAQFRMDSNVAESHAEGNKELAKVIFTFYFYF